MNVSQYWAHYERLDRETAKCSQCAKQVKTLGGSKKGLKSHLHMTGKPTSRPVPRLLVEITSVGEIKREVNFFITNITLPGSVEVARCFSAAGFFATKLRSRMGVPVLSALQEPSVYFNAKAK